MNARLFEIVKLIVLLGPILESSVLNGNKGEEYSGLYSCTFSQNYTLIASYENGQAIDITDFFCCKCISIYRSAPEFKDDLVQYVRAGGEINIDAMHCQKSLVNLGNLELVDWNDFLASHKELATQKDDNCASASKNDDANRLYYYSVYWCNSDGSMAIDNIYGNWKIAEDAESQEIRVTSSIRPASGQQFEVLINRVFADDFQVSQYCNSGQKLKSNVPLAVVPNHSFANGAHICNERLWLASDQAQFDPVLLIGTQDLQPTITETCEIALKKLKGDTSSSYQCIKGSKKVLLRVKEESLSILNVIVLDFGHSDLRALGSSVYFDPENPPQYNELCSSSGENLSNNGPLDFAAIELLEKEGVYIVKETFDGSEEIHFLAEIVINTNLTDAEPKKKVCLAPKIEASQSANNGEGDDGDDDAITRLSCKDLYKSRDSFQALNPEKRSKTVVVVSFVIGGTVALIIVGVVVWKLLSRKNKQPSEFQ
ncbi:MAG: hypothetical protein MHMPM18_001187 [Marteilia pararefringens]